MLVSVIIPTTPKEKPMLEKCLKALDNSTYKKLEIIVVDEGKERSEQRNIGIRRATGDCILYLDVDQKVSWYLIGECVCLIDSGHDAVYIPEEIITKGFFAYLRNWERQFYTATPIDCVRFMKRENCPEFDEELKGPEDSCHDRRVKGKRAVSRSKIYHEDNVTVLSYFKKKAYYAKSMKRFAEKYPNDKVLSFWWRCFGVFVEKGKYKMVLKRPDLFILIMLLILVRGVIYCQYK